MSQPSSDLVDFGAELQPGPEMQDPGMMAPPTPVRKQGFSIYTIMLILSFTFLTVATILLFINVGNFK